VASSFARRIKIEDYMLKEKLFRNRAVWRKWLDENHGTSDGVWMVYYKGSGAKRGVAYGDAIEEALCWGWIDSMIKKVDDEKYLRKFTPRRRGSIWSELNRKRIDKMITEGRMTKAGLARIEAAKQNGDWNKTAIPSGGLDDLPELKRALAACKKAKQYFESLAPAHQKQYLGWISSAKQDQTRARRIGQAIALLEQNTKLGMK
jgi:uncharacterized protein YdeI (YjbR/CyaY-like superfamily)